MDKRLSFIISLLAKVENWKEKNYSLQPVGVQSLKQRPKFLSS